MTTESPRTRPGATYPGGKLLRRARKRLAARIAAYESSKSQSGTRPGSLQV